MSPIQVAVISVLAFALGAGGSLLMVQSVAVSCSAPITARAQPFAPQPFLPLTGGKTY